MKEYINKHFSHKKKAVFCALFIFVLFSGISIFLLSHDARTFRDFTKDFFVSELSGNTLNMHYTIADPAAFGIQDYKAMLPSYSKEEKEISIKELNDSLKLLYSVDEKKLNEREGYVHRLMLPYLENEKNGAELYYYASPLSPSSGMQSQLPILLAEYTFRSKRDVADYLSILDQTDTYFGGITSFLKEQASQGLFMSDGSADKVIKQCAHIMDKESLKSGTHFLVTSFAERLNSLAGKGIISEKEKEAYLKNNNRLLTTVMQPAYDKLADELFLLKGSGKNKDGLYYYPQGKDYYLYLLRGNTGSYRDIKEIKQMLFDDFEKNLGSLYSLIQKNPDLFSSGEDTAAFVCKTPTDMLKNLQTMITSDFPPLTEVAAHVMPVCTVKNISKNLEEYCSPAFYLTPPLDDIHENVIYINQKNNPDGVDLYTTLAHEGYPGHLYQTVYSQMYFNKKKINPVRSLLSYGGYVEGWAMYVELNSYDYAKALMLKAAPETNVLYESYKLDRQIQLCLYSLLDVAIHYEGASYGQIHKMLSAIGINSPATTTAIYEYIVEEPTTYLKYYLGYLEIMELKKEARILWGDRFTDNNFHRFYLENGPADFSNLALQLKSPAALQPDRRTKQ